MLDPPFQAPEMVDRASQGGMVYRYVRTNENGLKIYQVEATVKIKDENNKIQILTIGKSNDKPTKTILLIGQTGAGKSTLLNATINHIRQVKADDDFRFYIQDEIGDAEKSSTVSQTEYVTGYLVYHQAGMPHECNFLIIDTPGLADTRGKEEQTRIRKQMEIFLREVKFEVDELHCLGFVINGTINRSHDYLRGIIHDFEDLFGKDTTDITKILATHIDETPPVSKVLKEMNIKADKMYSFDNGVLYSNCLERTRRTLLNKLKWENLVDQYEEFFEDLIIAKPVSLKLTREVIAEKMNLERSLMMLKKHIDNRVHTLLENKSKKKLYEKYNDCMRRNEAFEGEETITVKRRNKIVGRFTHAHNCPTCEQTCVYPCTALKSAFCMCPKANLTCEFCPCRNGDHKRECETINETLETIRVTHATMKDRYEQARVDKQSVEEVVNKLEKDIANQSTQIATYIKKTVQHIERINEITRNPNMKTPQEYIHSIIKEIKSTAVADIKDPSDRMFVINTLDALPQQISKLDLHEDDPQSTTLRSRFKGIAIRAKSCMEGGLNALTVA